MNSTIIMITNLLVLVTASPMLRPSIKKEAVFTLPPKVHKSDNPVAAVNKEITYHVKKLKTLMQIDGNWNKPQWRQTKPIDITHFMGPIPPFRPEVQAKMLYDDNNVYVIFRVHDRYVHSIVENYNGPVSGDACVEFFFSPDTAFRQHYFNLEINAGGTPLMAFHIYRQKEYQKFSAEELNRIEIFHSLPKKVDPQIVDPVTWTIEYRLPVALLRKFTSVITPEPGTIWRANFYKTASKSSNPHWITWAPVDNPTPSFHLPQFFGVLQFE